MEALRKTWQLLSESERRAAIVLLMLMIVGMVLETLGVGLVIPALSLMTQGDLARQYPALAPVIAWLGNPSRERLVMLGMLVLAVAYLVKAIFLVFLVARQTRFVFGVQAQLSQRLFAGYLRQPYTFHLQRNSAQLIRNAVGETDLFSKMALMTGLTLLTEVMVVIGITGLLLAVEPVGAVVVMGLLGASALAFHWLTDRSIVRWGKTRQMHEGRRIQHLQQGLGGVKDVKVLGREEAFLARYREHATGAAIAARNQATLQQVPRLALELLAVCGLAALVLVMLGRDRPIESLLPTLGLFAAAAFRLLPSANRVITSIHNVRFSIPVIDVLHAETCGLAVTAPPGGASPIELRDAITLEDVTFRYSPTGPAVLTGVSLRIGRGTSVGFIGGSGAGKSTLVDIVLGLLRPDTGHVRVDGFDINGDTRSWQALVGYVPQSVFLTDDSLRRNIAFGLPDAEIDEQAVWRALGAAQLEKFVRSLPDGLDTTVGERGIRLSGGQLQRIGIARALYRDPPVLVLDEATSSLDGATEAGVMEAVHALHGRKTVIIVAHRLSTIRDCDLLVRMEDGRVLQTGDALTVLQGASPSSS
jgi:ATP-binding cassette, subfamily B, bacterial PglK